MRLDFNKDGSVDMDDLRQSLMQFYEFLKAYDYLEATTRISSNLYDQAVRCIQSNGSQEQMSTSEQQEAAQEQPEGGAQDDIIDIAENVETFQETEQKASDEDIQQNASAAAQNQ